jgi:hypothetical protein
MDIGGPYSPSVIRPDGYKLFEPPIHQNPSGRMGFVHESGDFEGIYKDITHNTVYVVEWPRTKGWTPFLSFSFKVQKGSTNL